MTVLVTGGAGFIGFGFIVYQLNHYPDERVVCVDKLTYAGNLETLKTVMKNPNFCFYKADIADKDAVYDIFLREKPDVVVNFAAETHVDRSVNHYDLFLKTNVIGTQVLLDACLKHNVKHFHQISTDEVYGDMPVEKTDLLFHEESPLNPSSPYAASKAAADMVALSYFKTFNLPLTVTRSTNNYGPYQFPEKLIPLAVCRAAESQYVPLYGNGKNIRNWLYVDDHCKAVDLVMRKGAAGEIYNVGSHNEKSNIETVRAVLCALGKTEELIKFVKDRLGHDRRYSVDFSKIENELGWKAETDFNEGIAETVKWYLENQEWCRSIITDESREYFRNFYGEDHFFHF